jgi:hypothetical protein
MQPEPTSVITAGGADVARDVTSADGAITPRGSIRTLRDAVRGEPAEVPAESRHAAT